MIFQFIKMDLSKHQDIRTQSLCMEGILKSLLNQNTNMEQNFLCTKS